MIHEAVKTEARAIEILNNWLNDSVRLSFDPTVFKMTTEKCSCGETIALTAYYEGDNEHATVAICDCCGDDSHLECDVVNIW